MARIETVSERTAQGVQLDLVQKTKSHYGGVFPGIAQIILSDLELAGPTFQIYQHLNLSEGSPLTKLQRERVASVVNGLIGGRP